jgi:hypothetical protein
MMTQVICMAVVAALFCFALASGARGEPAVGPPRAKQWMPYEIPFTSDRDYANPYVDVELSVTFTASDGTTLRRPAFWDGGRTWRVRFASTKVDGSWSWKTTCSNPSDPGLHGRDGSVVATSYAGTSPLLKHGLLTMSPGKRNVLQADGTPFMLVGDTAWSLPWRGTPETVITYARDRQAKGFNAVLLMSVQPDRGAVGPRDRSSPGGFDVAFEDLPKGHLNQMNVGYFQYMDGLMQILVNHGIVPVYSPVFQGYGWKGLHPLGNSADPLEYARYCRYLVARYGASPAIWLVSADANGLAACVEAGGKEVQEWDAYGQPTGIHYDPADGDPALPEFAPRGKPHWNHSHQAAEWLDFQWCQTGHNGSHNVTKVERMHGEQPTKAVANGEPTYEGIRHDANGAGWWQGNEAWSNLTSGGTMGVAYGVAALWQWKFTADEPGWPEWARDQYDWRTALGAEGSRYVGFVAKAFEGYDFVDMTRHPELASDKPCVAVPGKFYCVYLEAGGTVEVTGLKAGLRVRWFDPKAGTWTEADATTGTSGKFTAPGEGPRVLFIGQRKPAS